ncbi:conserved hypothetical protein [Nocardioides sp. AX2bis]|nr:conserved hypothetical protein [Nocardioides sp. AX2bis]
MVVAVRGRTVPGNRWDLLADVPAPPPRVTVVVTHYQQPRELARTLRALARQDHPADLLQVVVADDGSSEPPRVPAGVMVVTHVHDGFGAAKARNRGAAAATGDVLVFLDADTTPEPGYVSRVARLPGLAPEVVTTGRRRHADLSGVPTDADVEVAGPAHELASPTWLRDELAWSRDLLDADETSLRLVLGAVVSCSAAMFAAAGGFDETFDRYGGEDWEWAHRAWTHGALLAHVPEAVAWHDGPDRAERPGWGTEGEGRERLLAETLAVGARIPAPGLGPAGLSPDGAADPLVTLDAGLGGDALVVAVDSLLAALPRARVLAMPEQHALLLGDHRVVVHPAGADHLAAAPARTAWRRLHLHAAVSGPPAAWTEHADLLRGADAAGHVAVTRGGAPLVTWSTLRAERRAARWGREDLHPRLARPASGLTVVGGDVTVQARWGGWR